MSYVQIHTLSAYSLMKSTIKIAEYVQQAAQMDYQVLGLVDEGVLSGSIEFYQACLKQNIRPIIGLTVNYYSEVLGMSQSITLIAKNYRGYQCLMHLSSQYQMAGELRTADFIHLKDVVFIFNNQHQILLNFEQDSRQNQELITELKLLANQQEIYFGIGYHQRIDSSVLDLLQANGIQLLAFSKVNILKKEEAFALKVLDHLQNGSQLKHDEIQVLDWSMAHELQNEAVYQEFYQQNCPQALVNLENVVQMIDLHIPLNQRKLPQYPLEGESAEVYLKKLCYEKLSHRVSAVDQRYYQRLDYELSIINQMGFADYFLIVWDVMDYAHKNHIVTGAGRGSAAGSLVAYVLAITDIDPIQYELIFERFLNPERQTMPDIDLDIPDNRRQEILHYVHQKYGQNHVVQIATFGTLAAKMVIRDVSRVFGLSQSEANRWSKAIPSLLKITLSQAYEQSKALRQIIEENPRNQLIFNVALILEGLPRHVSTHAAGVIISDENLLDLIPLQLGSDDILLSQFTMNDVQAIGLLKFDFLGLKNLAIIDDTLRGIQYIQKKIFLQNQIPLNDALTLKLFQKGDTTGVFQFESAGIRQVLRKVQPQNLEDLAAVNALYRPGPMQNIDEYVARKHGRKAVSFLDDSLQPILSNTYGIIVYQEQVMQIAAKMAGFTLAQADLLRRAISKKDHQGLDEQRKFFVQGALKNGYSQEKAEKVYSYIESFGDYGFNRSHSFAYSLIAYQMAYLKVHFPAAFFTALLNSVQNNAEKLKEYVHQLKKYDITLLPPDINASTKATRAISLKAIRLGLANVKGMRRDFLNAVIKERQENGNYTNFDNFLVRLYHLNSHWLKEELLIPLIATGCFDQLGEHRKLLLEQLEGKIQNFKISGGSLDLLVVMTLSTAKVIEPFSQQEILELEQQYLGLYISGHPLDSYQFYYDQKLVNEISQLQINQTAKIFYYLTNIKEITTKRGEKMAFLEGNDSSGEISVTIFPQLYRQIRKNLMVNHCFLLFGKVEKSKYNGELQMIADKVFIDEEIHKQLTNKTCFLRLVEGFHNQEVVNQVKQLLASSPGNIPVVIYDPISKQKVRVAEELWITFSNDLYNKLRQLLGAENVVMK